MYRQPGMMAPLLVSAANGFVRAREKTTGRMAWEVALTELPHAALVRLVVEGERVVGFGSRSVAKGGFFNVNEHYGFLFTLDYASGALGWTARIDGQLFSPTLLVEAPHVFLANGATTFAYDLANGHLLWKETDISVVDEPGYGDATPVALATPASNAQGDGL